MCKRRISLARGAALLELKLCPDHEAAVDRDLAAADPPSALALSALARDDDQKAEFIIS
jgi:hypothetical protein